MNPNNFGYEELNAKAKQIINKNTIKPYTPSFEEVQEVLSYIPIDQVIKTDMLDYYQTYHNEKIVQETTGFIVALTNKFAHASEWLIKQAPNVKDNSINQGLDLYTILAIATYKIKEYKSLGIDKKHITFNLKHLKGYITTYYNTFNNKLGISNYTWCIYLASLGLIHLHSLHFMHHIFSDPYHVFSHKKTNKMIVLAAEKLTIRKDGQINNVDHVNDPLFETTYLEDEISYTGYYVNPYGAVINKKITLSKKEYDLIITKGDYVIDYHIPSDNPYTIPDMKESFAQAITFFERVYPQYEYKAFWCLSWLSSPQIPLFLSKQGNIYHINEQSYTLPATHGIESIKDFVFHDKSVDLTTVKPKTSLENDIVNYVKEGGHIHCGVFLFRISDFANFGNSFYRSTNDWLEFKQLKHIKTD